MLRITKIDRKDKSIALKLEGKLIGKWVDLLKETYLTYSSDSRSALVLDLSDVGYVSRKGVDLLLDIQKKGVRFVSCPPFLKEFLIQ